MADTMKDYLFRLVETENSTTLGTITKSPGQLIIQDNGEMFYDNALNNRVPLSPDLSGFLSKTFADKLVTGVSFADGTYDDEGSSESYPCTIMTVTYIDPSGDSTPASDVWYFITKTGDVDDVQYDAAKKTITFIHKVVDEVTEGNMNAVTSNAVAVVVAELRELIKTGKELGIPVIKVIDVASDSNDNTALGTWKTVTGKDPKTGDIAILTHTIGSSDKVSRTAYVYNVDHWEAMDGNYDAANVYLGDNITLAGDYSTIGNYSKGNVITAGTSIQSMIMNMLTKRLQPSKSEPSASVTLNSGANEVGTKITPTYSASLSAGSYTYGPATGITATNWSVVAKNGSAEVSTLTTSSGSFDEITVDENTNYKVTATATYGAGPVALDNLGDASNPEVKIAAGSKSATSGAITGYRAWFYGYKGASSLLDVANLTSANIRALTSSNGSIPGTMKVNKMQQMFFAAPAGKIKSVSVVNAVNGAPQTVTKVTDIMVEGANGFTAVAYDVYYVSNAAAESGESTYTIKVTK